MSNREFAGGAVATTLTGGTLAQSATSITIASATGWPTGSGTATFVVVINRGQTDEEKVLIESRSGTTLTVASGGRGYDGTSDQAHANGSTIEHCVDAVWFGEVNSHLNATADAHDYTEITNLDERIRDVIGTSLTAGNNIDITVNDTSDTITVDVESLTSADISDFTTAAGEVARDALGTALTAGSGITITPNDTADTITIAASAGGTPVGTIIDFAGSSAPSGYLMCDGAAVSRTTYADLFAIIGTTYGVGNGSTTFNVPDCGGRVSAGKESSATRLTVGVAGFSGATLGATGGDQNRPSHSHGLNSHTHSIPAHSHTISWNGTILGGGTASTQIASGTPYYIVTQTLQTSDVSISGGSTTSGAASGNTASDGSGSSGNVQPTIVFNKCIKY